MGLSDVSELIKFLFCGLLDLSQCIGVLSATLPISFPFGLSQLCGMGGWTGTVPSVEAAPEQAWWLSTINSDAIVVPFDDMGGD